MTDGGSESSVPSGFFVALTDADTIGDLSQHTGISDFDEIDTVNMLMIPGVSTAPVFVAAIAYCELGRVERASLDSAQRHNCDGGAYETNVFERTINPGDELKVSANVRVSGKVRCMRWLAIPECRGKQMSPITVVFSIYREFIRNKPNGHFRLELLQETVCEFLACRFL